MTVPARWMTAHSRQYSPTAGAARLESVVALSPATEMLPIDVGAAGQQEILAAMDVIEDDKQLEGERKQRAP